MIDWHNMDPPAAPAPKSPITDTVFVGPCEGEFPYFNQIWDLQPEIDSGYASNTGSYVADDPQHTYSMSQVDQMADLESQNLTIVDSDDISFNGKHRIAFLDGGQAYILNLLPAEAEDVLALAPGSIQFPKSEVNDQSPDDQSGSGSIRHCFVYPPSEDPPENVSLDDEQARAVASLLEFHNQMASPYSNNKPNANTVNGTVSGSVITPSTSRLQCRIQEYHEEVPQILPHSSPEIGMDPLAITEPKKPPIKTYSRRGRNHADVPVQMVQNPTKIKQEPNAVPRFQVSSNMKNQKSSSSLLTAPPDLHMPRRKRRCVMDAVKVIPTSEFRQQLQDTSDIVQKKIDCAPPNKKAMYYLTYGGVGKFFAHPGRKVMSVPLAKLFFSRLTMTTEPKSISNSVNSVIKPLTSDLRIPGMSESDKLADLQSNSKPVSAPMLNDSVAKRTATATSFDNFCKGMTKPPKYEYKRKKKSEKTNLSAIDTPNPNQKIVPMNTADKLSSSIQTVSFLPATTSGSTMIKNETETIPVEIPGSDPTENHIVCTFHNNEIVMKTDIGPQTSEIFVEGNQETEVHSNFEMLIAAAEQHNSLPSASDANTLEESGQARVKEIKEEEDEDGNKTDVVYCTNEEMEQLIILGSNGERYRVTTSTQGELTLWPEPECDTN